MAGASIGSPANRRADPQFPARKVISRNVGYLESRQFAARRLEGDQLLLFGCSKQS